MKTFITTLLATMTLASAWAVPAINQTFKHKMADGTEVSLRLIGDEHFHYFLNEVSGEKLTRRADNRFELLSEAEFQSLKEIAIERRTANDRRRSNTLHKAKSALGEPGTITGQKKGIVILVNFADKTMISDDSQTIFYNIFNQEGYSQNNQIGSVSDYFKAQSYGQFELDFDVVGPLTVSKNMAYYGQNKSSGSGNDMHAAEMVREACQLADEQVNFADYDWDGDGWVDQVFVIYAGYAESSGADENTIWPHEWDFYSAGVGALRADNVYINTYACSSELAGTSGSSLNGIGTACHEFSHCLGYPDFYDTDYSGGIGLNNFDIMSGGSYNGPYNRGEVPCGFTAYERWMAGWLEPIELTEPEEITNMPALNDEGKAYIIYNDKNRNEYFLLENRQSRGWFRYFSNFTNGHGLFIYHVDYNSNAWKNNQPNDDPNHQRMSWVPADKKYGTYYSQYQQWSVSSIEAKGDFFPGTSKVKVFNPEKWSSTGGKWFNAETDGTYYSKHFLSLITESDGKISFKFDIGDSGNRYTVTYDAVDGVCDATKWTQTTSSEQATTLPKAISGDSNWSFAGWSRSKIESVQITTPELLLEGDTFLPTENTTLYAVYSYIPEEGFWTSQYSGADMRCRTITLIAGDGTCPSGQLTQSKPYAPVTLPVATIDDASWSFAGWASTQLADTTFYKPEMLEAGDAFIPTTDTTLYAVFKQDFKAIELWKLTAAAEVKEAGIYVLLTPDAHSFTGSFSLGNGKISSTTASFNELGETDVMPSGSCELTLTAVEGGYTMYNEAKGYLYAKSASTGNLAWHATETSFWKYAEGNWQYDANGANLRSQNNKSFRNYPDNTGSEVQFAHKVSGMEALYYHTPSSVTANAIVLIGTEQNNMSGIYTLDGRKINATREQLPSGIYLVNGKKTVMMK